MSVSDIVKNSVAMLGKELFGVASMNAAESAVPLTKVTPPGDGRPGPVTTADFRFIP